MKSLITLLKPAILIDYYNQQLEVGDIVYHRDLSNRVTWKISKVTSSEVFLKAYGFGSADHKINIQKIVRYYK